jgi:hypothetical protein
MLRSKSEHTASILTLEDTVQDAFDFRGAARESQEERSGAPASDDPTDDIMDLAQNLERALGIEDSTQFLSEDPPRNNRADSFKDEQSREFQVLVLPLPNGKETRCQGFEKETIQWRRTCPDEEEDEETCSFNSADSLKYYRKRSSCSLSSEEEKIPGPEAATTAVELLSPQLPCSLGNS